MNFYFSIILFYLIFKTNLKVIIPLYKNKIIKYNSEYLFPNNYYSKIKVGKQQLNMKFVLLFNHILIFGSNISFSKYNECLSDSFETYNYYENFETNYNVYYYGNSSSDYFLFDNVTERLEFYLIHKISNSDNIDIEKMFFNGMIGLQLNSDHEIKSYNLVYQLKYNKIIDNYNYYFDYNKENLVLGEYFDENDKNFYKANSRTRIWDHININFNNIYYNEYSKNNKKYNETNVGGLISLNTNGIVGTNNYKTYFDEFMKENFPSCNKIYFSYASKNYYGYECHKNINIKNFKSIKFFNQELNHTFELDYNDIFVKCEDKYVMMIYFKDDENQFAWILGTIFLKKYKLIFNLSSQTIGMMKNLKEKNDKIILYIICCILLIIIIILSIFLYRCYLNKPRKIKANELNENYDFVYSKNENDETKKNKIELNSKLLNN